MQTPLTAVQEKLLHTQCPTCNENELTEMDSIMPDEPFLWCAGCDTTIDGEGKVEKCANGCAYHDSEGNCTDIPS